MANGIKITKPDGSSQYLTQGPSGDFDQPISEPSNRQPARIGISRRTNYTPEPQHYIINTDQFAKNLYFDPSYRWTPGIAGTQSVAERVALGVNLMTQWEVTPEEKQQNLSGVAGILILTESSIHGGASELEGFKYFDTSLEAYEAFVINRVPSIGGGADVFSRFVQFNIETSNSMDRAYFGDTATPFWPAWSSVSGKQTRCEFDGQMRTYQQLSDQGLFPIEAAYRRANRLAVLFAVVKNKAAQPYKQLYGSSIYQGYPDLNKVGQNTAFLLSSADVSKIGGDNQGNITLNGRAYKLTGSQYANEDWMSGYYYLQTAQFSLADYQDIFQNRRSETQNYPYLWSRMKPWHIVADEKGYWQMAREQMMLNLGKTHPILRMDEPMYESDYGDIDGQSLPCRIPFPQLQNSITFAGVANYVETPKVWQPPVNTYSRQMTWRFLCGADGGGMYTFNTNPVFVKGDLTKMPLYNHHLHAYTARFQARMDMQPLEAWFAGSTMVENPEVQMNSTGSFTAYTGPQAFGYRGGVWGPPKPAFIARYKAVSGGWEVKLLGGMLQANDSVSTHTVRIPGLQGNTMQVTLRGYGAHLFEFVIKASDSNQNYVASAPSSSYSKPGYGGRVQS